MQGKNKGKTSSASSTDLIYGRVLPHAKDIERQVLGVVLSIPDTVDTVLGLIDDQVFYSENYRRIFKAVTDLHSAGSTVDVATVGQRLKEIGELDLVGGQYHVTNLTNDVISAAPLESYCLKLREVHMRRELIQRSAENYSAAFDETRDVFDLLDDAEQTIMGIGNSIQSDSAHLSSVLVDTVRQIEEWRKNDNAITGVPSGFPKLDRATRGWQPGNLIILAARPSVGKSAFALALARAAALNDIRPTPVAFFSLEMDNVQLALRLLAAESGTLLHGLQTGRMDDDQMRLLHIDGISKLAKIPIYMDDKPALSVMKLRAKARRLKKRHNIGMIIVDYLQLMDGVGNNREQEVSSISRGLKKLAKELKIPIIALSQLSRQIESRTGTKRIPQLSDLRESGGIEQDADLVIFLWPPEESDIDQNKDLIYRRYARIAKSRDGMLISVDLEFKNEIQAFKEYRDLDGPGAPPGVPGNWKPLPNANLFDT